MVLSQINPVGADFIKNFPSQNAVNCDRIDDYAGPCLTSHPLQSYSPQLTGTTTDPVLGTGGFIRGFFYEIFDQIYIFVEFRFGTAAINIGSGVYLVSLPFEATSVLGASSASGKAPVVGSGYVHDNDAGANRTPITAHLRTTTQLMFGIKMDSGIGRVVAQNAPFGWAINDGMSFSARFKRLA